ncbi:MAG: hypothetical protein NC331_10215 [Lachnospiraceae bacterium]|nr:hypothetical protein [Lachnospiraceae bacterium]MCM1239746.1 hypothetical protein [Lachnospiraceae bacterium]
MEKNIMYLDLSGKWNIELTADSGVQRGEIVLPGSLQGAGYGNPVTIDTPWVSGLHDAFWYEQEPFKKGNGEECRVPFLCQPVRHFIGEAVYEREFRVDADSGENWILRIELTRWRTKVWIDGVLKGEDCSLCTAHEIDCGRLLRGTHRIRVSVDNSMQYPYRPDGHGVSDALGATWNGMAGEIALITEKELQRRQEERSAYAKEHPRRMEVKEGNFCADGIPFYFRATHFGGDYPMKGYPETDIAWWKKWMRTIKEWGLNSIRCHSYCPPEAAFWAADEEEVFLLVECGMWNTFEKGIPMLEVLRQETGRILRQFGHHPSFALFSPSNEPDGRWYEPLREWVEETRAFDRELGYEGRRLYTMQSGWPYPMPPKEIVGTDFIYFHRSGYGPKAGSIRNAVGWRGKDYSVSLEGVTLPVVCHELGQWCVYPDFKILSKMEGKGYLRPRNFELFREIAEENGVLSHEKDFLWCSGRNQLRLYKEELEADFRTPGIKGFELLDLHDYAGQGTALVGFLDILWENKGYAAPEEFRHFCGDTVLLARFGSYVWKNNDRVEIPVEVSHFGKRELSGETLRYRLTEGEKVIFSGKIPDISMSCGSCRQVGSISLDFSMIEKSSLLTLELELGEVKNSWQLTVFARPEMTCPVNCLETNERAVLYTRKWQEAKEALAQGRRVVYAPYLSELSYECPALSIRNIFWNGQMGPAWIRNLGIVAKESHPVFRAFPTARDGGWQWEDILAHSRGFWLKDMDGVEPIVRPIDDWNRSLSLGLMFEAKVGPGSLFVVSADLEGSFEERPAAWCLKQAILDYVSSEEFAPSVTIACQSIEEKLFPVLRMEQIAAESVYDEDADVISSAETQANPYSSTRIEKDAFPVIITLNLKKQMVLNGILYLPEQKDRAHEGFIRDYRLECFDTQAGDWKLLKEGVFLNTCLSQQVLFDAPVTAGKLRLTVLSCYGCVDKTVWVSGREGWRQERQKAKAIVQVAGLHVICDEPTVGSDVVFWARGQKSSTKEIDN